MTNKVKRWRKTTTKEGLIQWWNPYIKKFWWNYNGATIWKEDGVWHIDASTSIDDPDEVSSKIKALSIVMRIMREIDDEVRSGGSYDSYLKKGIKEDAETMKRWRKGK